MKTLAWIFIIFLLIMGFGEFTFYEHLRGVDTKTTTTLTKLNDVAVDKVMQAQEFVFYNGFLAFPLTGRCQVGVRAKTHGDTLVTEYFGCNRVQVWLGKIFYRGSKK